MDLIDCLNIKTELTNIKSSINRKRTNRTKTVMPFKKQTTHFYDNNIVNKSQSSVNRCPENSTKNNNIYNNKNNQNNKDKKLKGNERIYDSARRHASCGPRIITTTIGQIDDSMITSDTSLSNNLINNNSNGKQDIKCIGNKYCLDINSDNSLTSISTLLPAQLPLSLSQPPPPPPPSTPSPDMRKSLKSSHHYLTPRTCQQQHQHQSLYQKHQASHQQQKQQHLNKLNNKFSLINNSKDYRKYVNNSLTNFNNKFQSKLTANDNYCSHFFAVGLSLRAWRSKYNKILKTQKDLGNLKINDGGGGVSGGAVSDIVNK